MARDNIQALHTLPPKRNATLGQGPPWAQNMGSMAPCRLKAVGINTALGSLTPFFGQGVHWCKCFFWMGVYLIRWHNKRLNYCAISCRYHCDVLWSSIGVIMWQLFAYIVVFHMLHVGKGNSDLKDIIQLEGAVVRNFEKCDMSPQTSLTLGESFS